MVVSFDYTLNQWRDVDEHDVVEVRENKWQAFWAYIGRSVRPVGGRGQWFVAPGTHASHVPGHRIHPRLAVHQPVTGKWAEFARRCHDVRHHVIFS